MAHHHSIRTKPGLNKDGSPSKRKKDHIVTVRGRQGRVIVGVQNSRKAAEELILKDKANRFWAHLRNHPNDLAFRRKHGVPTDDEYPW